MTTSAVLDALTEYLGGDQRRVHRLFGALAVDHPDELLHAIHVAENLPTKETPNV
ncbi:hypothetical protein [Rhodococcus oxybenzonivorans]|uniref:hypothetical protein n=1 Tax=Rhodococcus oxybenzonivorans TaxID=1990687 RepID=UPI0013A53A36|nr:hypothetical protein [Rhodococcus oxybenzonivorans]